MEPERSNRTPGPGRPKRAAVYARLEEAVAELRDRWGGLPGPEESRAIWDDIWVHEAYNSTTLEGNTLVLREVGQLLRDGRAVGSKQLADYLEVQGYAAAASWVYGQALRPDAAEPSEQLTVTEVRHVHQLALQPVWDFAPHAEATGEEAPGAFRRHDIHRSLAV